MILITLQFYKFMSLLFYDSFKEGARFRIFERERATANPHIEMWNKAKNWHIEDQTGNGTVWAACNFMESAIFIEHSKG